MKLIDYRPIALQNMKHTSINCSFRGEIHEPWWRQCSVPGKT